MVSTRTECSILLCCPFYEKRFQLSQLSTLPCFITCPISVCLWLAWDTRSTRAQKRSPRQDREGQAGKAACVGMGKGKATWKMTTDKLQFGTDMYFPASGFIASLLWEQEPRRLFNIISSSQYIIPLQILVYLCTRLTFMDRDEWK